MTCQSVFIALSILSLTTWTAKMSAEEFRFQNLVVRKDTVVNATTRRAPVQSVLADSLLQCAVACQINKCCFSMELTQEGTQFRCDMFDMYYKDRHLAAEPGGRYMIKDPQIDAQSHLTWSNVTVDYAIRYYDDKIIRRTSLEQCMNYCVNELSFLCVSVDWRTTNGICMLSSDVKDFVGDDWSVQPSFLFYERLCI